ncbi:hypothetical protein DRN74_01530 [Candidatus Micrarchaeota archaeon]|nr:MAG: hypothetical protein DRN74_01530 [Candidatus Micrarchaeota archaeon]
MGMAMAVYRIYPEENADLAQLVDEISKIDKVKSVQREPIAFGLEVIKVGILFDDKKDKPEETEEKIRSLAGVREMESLDVTLIS